MKKSMFALAAAAVMICVLASFACHQVSPAGPNPIVARPLGVMNVPGTVIGNC